MAMSNKDYETIADVLREYGQSNILDQGDPNFAFIELIAMFALALGKDNGNFDPDKFEEACCGWHTAEPAPVKTEGGE
tara:strand:+ start:416 stop:649 length:234 start_codon:yes stop_codon:yes gene_type:complete